MKKPPSKKPPSKPVIGLPASGSARPVIGAGAVSAIAKRLLPGQIVLFTSEPFAYLGTEMGPDSPRIVNQPVKYSITDLQKQRGLLDYDGRDPLAMQVHLYFDDFAAGKSVESLVDTLVRMATPPKEATEPQNVQVAMVNYPAEARGVDNWKITLLEWGDDVKFNRVGVRSRQDVKVTLTEYITAQYLIDVGGATKKKVNCSKVKAPKNSKLVTVKKGETVQKISTKLLGSPDCWKVIRWASGKKKGNKIRDPKEVKAGDRLRLP